MKLVQSLRFVQVVQDVQSAFSEVMLAMRWIR